MSITVSVITITLNSAETIAHTINSVLSQSGNDYRLEYIIIDGASKDGTQEIVRTFGNAINFFLSEPDAGISDAFNKGINIATGDVVGIINSDDVLLPSTLTRVTDFFLKNPAVDILHGDVFLYDGNNLLKRISPSGKWWYPWRMVLFNHPSTFVRKKVYQQCGLFNLDYYFAMDVELFLRWRKKGLTIAYLNEPLAIMQTGGVSGQYAYKAIFEKRKALLDHGYSSILANLQLIVHFVGQIFLLISSQLKKWRIL